MKVTQYATGDMQNYREYNLKPATFMAGAVTVVPSEQSEGKKFL